MTDNPLKRPGTYTDTSPERVLYEEHRSAYRPSMIVQFLIGLAVLVGGIALIAAAGGAYGLLVVLGFVVMGNVLGDLVIHRHTGLRITTKQLSIGAVTLDGAKTRSDGTVALGKRTVSCSWAGVRTLAIVTDPKEIRGLRAKATVRTGVRRDITQVRTPGSLPIGLFLPVRTKAVLLINADQGVAEFPPVRQKKLITWVATDTLAVATRHPDRLRAALASYPTTERITAEVTHSADATYFRD